MQPFPPATPSWPPGVFARASGRTWTAYLCTLVIGIALPLYDALHNTTPDTHPLQPDRLLFRLVGLTAIAANFAIVGVVAFRLTRAATRRRNGQCPACGYDLRASVDRCPECGSPSPAPH